jgi:hypothetical protein
LLWLVVLVIGKGTLLGVIGLGLCLSDLGGPPPPDGCRNVVQELAQNQARTVELVVSLAAGAGLAYRR